MPYRHGTDARAQKAKRTAGAKRGGGTRYDGQMRQRRCRGTLGRFSEWRTPVSHRARKASARNLEPPKNPRSFSGQQASVAGAARQAHSLRPPFRTPETARAEARRETLKKKNATRGSGSKGRGARNILPGQAENIRAPRRTRLTAVAELARLFQTFLPRDFPRVALSQPSILTHVGAWVDEGAAEPDWDWLDT